MKDIQLVMYQSGWIAKVTMEDGFDAYFQLGSRISDRRASFINAQENQRRINLAKGLLNYPIHIA